MVTTDEEIRALVDRETAAWNARDAEALVSLFHPDTVWPWPPNASAHDPIERVMPMGKFDRERWRRSWQALFETHDLVHNNRKTLRVAVSDQGDGAFAVGGALGTLALYRGLAVGQMSVVAPLSAVVTAALPVIIGLSMGEHLSLSARVGVGTALPAICLISWGGVPGKNDSRHAGFAEGALSGVGFALLFVSLARAGTQSGAWPLVPGQVVALVLVLPFGWRTRRGWQSGSWTTTLAVAAGVLCGMANLMFLAATSHGQLSIVAVLTSLYPAVTVLFARLVLGERWNVVRIAGFVATAVAIVLITVG